MVPLLALFAAVAFACSNVSALRGTLWAEPRQGVRLTVLMGVPIFAFLALLFGQLGDLDKLSWKAWALFAAAGVVHFIAGRSLGYLAARALGASRATVVTTLSPLFSVALAVVLFGDRVTWSIALGGLLVILGPVLIAQGDRRHGDNPSSHDAVIRVTPAQLKRGVLLGVGAALAWGISPILVKGGLTEANVPVLGTFISYSAAAALLGSLLVRPAVRRGFVQMDRRGVLWYSLAGFSVSMAQFLRYLALSQGSVTIVVLLMQAVPIFVIVLSFLINRRIESLNRYVVAGGFLVTLGTIIIATG